MKKRKTTPKVPVKQMELFEVWAGPDYARDHFFIAAKDFITATRVMFQKYDAETTADLPSNCVMERIRDDAMVLVVMPKKR